MIIAGAGGHALEVLDILTHHQISSIAVYGEEISPFWPSQHTSYTQLDQVGMWLAQSPEFVLGVGSPTHRKKLFQAFSQRGGVLQPLRGPQAIISPSAKSHGADVLSGAFVGAHVQLGLGVLVNTGAQIHHEVRVGDFSVINPGAVLLGACQIGSECFIGAQATILPGVRIGDRVTIGAGAVIIRDVPPGVTVVGVPGRILPRP